MRLRWACALLCLLLPFFFVNFSAASNSLRVNETATGILLREKQALVTLSVVNPTEENFPARISIELLDPSGRIFARASHDESLQPGSNSTTIAVPLELTKVRAAQMDYFLWSRLHYRITRAPGASISLVSPEPIEGILSLSEIASDIFELHISANGLAREGLRYRARVRASHPVSGRPLQAVKVEGVIEFENDAADKSLRASALTGADGSAILDFVLPRHLKSEEAELKISARHGQFIQEAAHDIHFDHLTRILINTDKPLYQPGQVLHARALIFSPSMHALALNETTFKIKDPEGTIIYSVPLKTSRFGVASADWTIPETTRLGQYTLSFSRDDADESEATAEVKISRYDLPNFAVKAEPDHSYYLPGQDAQVEVRADYLFGQPVARGHVRVVREKEREWNYLEQRYETKEGEKYEGELQDGRFVARINLQAAHDDLKDEDYHRFSDYSYVASVTDATTNRTEQRRFDLRITKEAIHVYIITQSYSQSSRLPLQFYLSTFYADGAPAPCELTISQSETDAPANDTNAHAAPRPLLKLRTNRYGIAKVNGLALAQDSHEKDEASLDFSAHDDKGQTGSHTETFQLEDTPGVRVETDKSVYRMGEPLRVTIISSEPKAVLNLDVVKNWSVIRSKVIRLHEGRASFVLPPDEEFKDTITIAAYADLSNDEHVVSTRTVIYPRDRDLRLDLQTAQDTYRPGEDASLALKVRAPDGRAVESALGIVIFDKAVEERARTDNEFGSRSGDSFQAFRYLLGEGDALSGINLRDLEKLDITQLVSPDLSLLSEVLLNKSLNYYPDFFSGDSFDNGPTVFEHAIKSQVAPISDALEKLYARSALYPHDEASLRQMLSEAGINLDAQLDPWGRPFQAVFSIDSASDLMDLVSAGPDKQYNTKDDFSVLKKYRPYFKSNGEAIDRALAQYQKRTGGFISEAETLRREAQREGVNLSTMRDRWGQPYRIEFEVKGTKYVLSIKSGGPNKQFETEQSRRPDDFIIWTNETDYFKPTQERLSQAIASQVKETGQFPQHVSQLRQALQRVQVDFDALRDPWGHPYYAIFSTLTRNTGRVTIESRAAFGNADGPHTLVTPLTDRTGYIDLYCAGADGQESTTDDFVVASFSGIVNTQSSAETDPPAATTRAQAARSGATGAIQGTITDPQGAVVPGVIVKATNASATRTFETTSDENGRYILRNLPAGIYVVSSVGPSGFMTTTIVNVRVNSSTVTEVNLFLQVAALAANVTVTSESSQVQNISATDSKVVGNSPVTYPHLYSKPNGPVQTPRLREYFPETLVWQPSLETDKDGRAQLQFKLADNITTWKMLVIGSTLDGEIGLAEKEIRAFQPFFVEHDPPRTLTEGDEISLPVVLRNYLDQSQAVDLELKTENWFTPLGPTRKHTDVAAHEAAREIFDFRATASIKDGKQRVTANSPAASDAIEKVVSVHPDGEEKVRTTSEILVDSATLEVNIPEDFIKGSLHEELKIYPNLMSHVAEGIEGILQRPYGCGEQTISSTYPSLLLLRESKRSGRESALADKARRYLQAGYERLLNYRTADGGFSYWGRGDADMALTAYALRFLHDAREFLSVDETIERGAREWLIRQQRVDGSWPSSEYGRRSEEKQRTAIITSYIARSLALTKEKDIAVQKPASGPPPDQSSATALKRALNYLSPLIPETNEPYLLASYVLAALDGGEPPAAEKAINRLRALAHDDEAGVSYWNLETNTPFYGWGLTGRIETTALAVQALARSQAADTVGPHGPAAPERHDESVAGRDAKLTDAALVNRGLLFLLRHKDRYGVWHSTQTTINVLDTLITLLSTREPDPQAIRNLRAGQIVSPAEEVSIVINGQSLAPVSLPQDGRSTNPITLDISQFLSGGANRIELRRAGGSTQASTQVVSTYYVPWSNNATASESRAQTATTGDLRLALSFDKTEAGIGDEINCRVEAERVGSHGYGMLLAQIGLPPGAEVDRASLENAMRSSGWSFSQYDVLPDRLVVYLWPRAGGTQFSFKFRTRFGLAARSAPSTIYDYYNPEASAVIAPTKFVIK